MFEFSTGPPSQDHSVDFTPVVSQVSGLLQCVGELVPVTLAVIGSLEG